MSDRVAVVCRPVVALTSSIATKKLLRAESCSKCSHTWSVLARAKCSQIHAQGAGVCWGKGGGRGVRGHAFTNRPWPAVLLRRCLDKFEGLSTQPVHVAYLPHTNNWWATGRFSRVAALDPRAPALITEYVAAPNQLLVSCMSRAVRAGVFQLWRSA